MTTARNRKPRICLVAHNAYGALARVDTGHIGGIERQTSLMARWLAAQGYDVSMITWGEGQSDDMAIDGVRIVKMCHKDAGIRGLRFFHPRWTSLNRAMRRASADVYYYNCADLGLGQVVIWCRRHGLRSVYSVASDFACDARLPKLQPLRERVLYRYGLNHAHSVIAQTRRQQQMLREQFRVESTVIPMPFEGFATDTPAQPGPACEVPPRVFWVGRIAPVKRFEWLLDIAERCPEIRFDVAGTANVDGDYARALTKRASGIPNVNMQGRVLHPQIAKCYRRCRVLCCTSANEGFPNTFLEAWSCGIPVVSTFDPDGIVAKYNLGWVASNIDELVDGLKTAMTSPEKWHAASQAARSYYLENHTIDATMPKFEKQFRNVL